MRAADRQAGKSLDPSFAWPYSRLIYSLVAAAALTFMFLIYVNAASSEHPGSSPLKLFFIRATITVPELVIWAIAAVAALRFKAYANHIRKSADGEALNLIANALLLMVLYVVLLTMSNSVVTLFKHSHHLGTAVSIGNHLPILVVLATAVYLFAGSQKLNRITPSKVLEDWRFPLVVAGFGVFAAFFIWNFYRIVPALEPIDGIPRFSLSTNTLLFTYVLPHLVMWGLGLLACLNIFNYTKNNPGVIYKQLFGELYRGILLVFICIFMAQLIIISSISVDTFNIWLLLIYGLLILGTVGFALIYRGSEKLEKIEAIH